MNRKVKFELTAIDKTKAAFDRVGKGLKVIGGGAKMAGMGVAKIGLAAAGAATALAALVKINTDFMDKLGKTASKLGIEVEFLQNMRFAAEQTGVKVEALDMGLQRFIRRAAEAASGTGEAKRAFQQLGIQLKDGNGNLRDVELLMNDVADGIMNTSDSAEQVRLAFKFFDSEGVSLVNTLKNGSKGLQDFKTEAENLGLIISKESIAKAEMFADSLNILKKQFTAITANLTAAFIPIMQDASTALSEMMTELKGNDDDFEQFGKAMALHVIEGTKNATLAIYQFFLTVRLEFEKLKAVFGQGNPELVRVIKQIEEMDASIAHLNKTGQENSQFMTNSKRRMAELREEFVRLAGKDGSQGLIDAFDAMSEKVKNFTMTVDEAKGKDPVKGMSETVSKFVDEMGVTDDAISKLTMNTMKKFEDSIIDGLKNGKLAFKDFANYAIEQILRIAIQEAILKPITGGVESFFSGIFGRSIGGGVNKGQPYKVGESGTELFVPQQSGKIISNNDLQGMGGNQSAPIVNFNISTVDAAGFDELLVSRKGTLTAIINQAMNSRGRMGIV
jgi:hypothetical protein